MKKTLWICAVLLFGTSSELMADWTEGSRLVGVNAGVALPLSRFDAQGGGSEKIGDLGLSVSGQYFYHVLPEVAFGLDVGYFRESEKTSGTLVPGARTDSRSDGTVGLALGKWVFRTNGTFLPYMVGGAGLHVTTRKVESAAAKYLDDSRTGWAAAAGLGVDVPLNRRLVWGLEGRYTYLSQVTHRPMAAGRAAGLTGIEGSAQHLHWLTRLGWQF